MTCSKSQRSSGSCVVIFAIKYAISGFRFRNLFKGESALSALLLLYWSIFSYIIEFTRSAYYGAHHSSKNVIPSAYTSLFWSCFKLRPSANDSGDMYNRVPATVGVFSSYRALTIYLCDTKLIPKSPYLISRESVKKTFSGLISRWTTFFEWMYCNPFISYMVSFSRRSSEIPRRSRSGLYS